VNSGTGEPWAPQVTLTIPASAQYLVTARLVTADIASGIGMPIDVIEDLRVAVDEALTMLIAGLEDVAQSTVTCQFGTTREMIRVRVESSAPVVLAPPSDGGYAWIVLDAVSDEFDVKQLPSATRISFERASVAPVGQVGHRDTGATRT